ncbi:hypothetical protein FO519_000255 [Halicephalobus sp. NKZ332]|nr:hypothetical protein FO519_000255 [Halicephalobus sp. NKZ332]
MKRQNSIPQPLKQNEGNQRRSSHEIPLSSNFVKIIGTPNSKSNSVRVANPNPRPKSNSVKVIGQGFMTGSVPSSASSRRISLTPPTLTLEGNNINFGKRVTLTEETIELPGSIVSGSPKAVTFGYASGAHHSRRNSCDCEASTSESKEIEVEDETASETDEHQIGLFFVRNSDGRTVPMYCHQPVGEEADQFLQNIGNRYKERLKKFIENEKGEESEHYVWIKTDFSGKTTILSLTQLANHFNNDKVKRVKWRHLSIDRITVYRYSVPIITTKFRLRVMHFLSRNYRCCILCVWCFVILFISIGIVLSVVFGSAPYLNSVTRRNGTNGYMFSG